METINTISNVCIGLLIFLWPASVLAAYFHGRIEERYRTRNRIGNLYSKDIEKAR